MKNIIKEHISEYTEYTKNIDEAIYIIDDVYVSGEFYEGIRSVDHNALLSAEITFNDLIHNGTILVPENKTAIGNIHEELVLASGYEIIPVDDNHLVGFKEGTENTYSLHPTARVFVDMDGVLAKFNPIESEEVLYEKGYFRNLDPQEKVVKAISTLIDEHPNKVYVLSAVVDSPYAIEEKNEWLHEHLPKLSDQQIIFSKVGENKANVIPGSISNQDFLIDDYTKNLTAWEEVGGSGIKLINDINDTNQSWKGPRVSFSDRRLLDSIKTVIDPTYVPLDDGKLEIHINYSSANPLSIKDTIEELNQRFSNVSENEFQPDVKLSISIDGEQLIDSEAVSVDELVANKKDFKTNDMQSFLNIAKNKVSTSIKGGEDFEKNIDRYKKIQEISDTVNEEVLIEETLVIEESVSISL